MTSPQVRFEAVSKRFNSPPTLALEGLDLKAAANSVTAVIGVSGSGKSTLLRLAGGLDTPTSGRVLVGGQSPGEVRRAKNVGWMSQHSALLPWKTALENIRLGATVNIQIDRATADPEDLLDLVGLAGFADAYPSALSGGMQQRVALARVLAVGAPLWLMDEPFAALDELTRSNLAEELSLIWTRVSPTVIWVTHHIGEAVKLADTVVLLTPRPGRVMASIEVDLARPRDETSPAFQAIVRRARRLLASSGRSHFEVAG